MNPHIAMHMSCMTEWHRFLQITRKKPSCPLCQQTVPWAVAVSVDDLEFLMLWPLDADLLLAPDVDAVDALLNDFAR
jgi:hypothetical protein